MTSKIKQQGFTIVELLIVIVVIGILAALVITTFTGIQQQARDTERQTDINAIHSHVEAYYAQNGYYPALADLTAANLTGLDPDALTAPGQTTAPTAAAPTTDRYQYAPVQADGTTACAASDATCVDYTLSADLEGETTNYTKNSLN